MGINKTHWPKIQRDVKTKLCDVKNINRYRRKIDIKSDAAVKASLHELAHGIQTAGIQIAGIQSATGIYYV